ncbi:MAG: hypothetical protein HYY67_05380 [Thaumarchaeota archaeon]|nr:hypothetical protein [Nitrososphaerota archaeon]
MATELTQISFIITAFLVAVSLIAFLLATLRALKIKGIRGMGDFRVQMLIVAWIWLMGEIVELLIGAEPGPSLHIASMIIFSTFIILRTKSYLI